MDSSQKCSSIKKMRQNFSRQVRKSKIEKIQKDKREKQMKISNPVIYIQKLKLEITTTDASFDKIGEWIEFLGQNIKDQNFADIIQREQLIQIIILKSIEKIDPWIHKQIHKQNDAFKPMKNYDTCLFPRKCECTDCSENSTSTSEFEGVNYNQKAQIDRKQGIQIQGFYKKQISSFEHSINVQQQTILNQLLDLLHFTFDSYAVSDDKKSIYHKKFNQFQSQKQIQLQKFHGLFVHTPEILQGLLLDLITYHTNFCFQENIDLVIKSLQMSEKMNLIFKIVSFIAKAGHVCCFDEQHWKIILEIYVKYLQATQTESKYEHTNTKQMKQLFIVLYKSYLLKDILFDSKNINQFNKLILPVLKQFNQTLRSKNHNENRNENQSDDILWKQFDFFMRILNDLKFIQKQANDEIKLILGEILNICKKIEEEEEGQNNYIKFIHISPRIRHAEESDSLKKCRKYAQKLIQILYLQMELSEDDLYRISQVQPSMRQKIQQIIDADMY